MIELVLPKIGIGTIDDPYRPDWTGHEKHEPNLYKIIENETNFVVTVRA